VSLVSDGSTIDASWLAAGQISRDVAMSIPVAAACRNLICGTMAQLAPRRARGQEFVYGGTLLTQPDPSTTLEATVKWTTDDLIHYGRAYWLVIARDGIATERNPRGLPVRARRLDPRIVSPVLSDELTAYDRILRFDVAGQTVERDNIIVFHAGGDGVLAHGASTLQQAANLENAARRMATVDLPAGVLRNEGTELSPEEAADLVQSFTSARQRNSIAFLQGVSFETSQINARDLQLVEARAMAATAVAQLYGVPVAMVGVSPMGNSASLLYANVSQNYANFLKQSVAPIALAIEQALSLDTVTPHGQKVSFDTQSFLRSDPEASVHFVTELIAAGIITADEARSFLGVPAEGMPTSNNLTPGEI
jgi:HK97 family phage portal protein